MELKMKNLVRDYNTRSKEECGIKPTPVMTPADPRKMT